MRTSNLFLMSGILLVASTAYSQCASCGGGGGVGHSIGGGFSNYSAGSGGCNHGKCGNADHLWDGFCNESSCGCGTFGGGHRCGGLFSKFGGGCGNFGGGWFGLGAGSQRCGGCGCGEVCGDACGCRTCGSGHGWGSRGGFGWPNKLTYGGGSAVYSNAGSCCGGDFSNSSWSNGFDSGETWSEGNGAETIGEPEPQPATKPSTDSSTWEAPSSQWNVNERNNFNAPTQTPAPQNKGPFYNIPPRNNGGNPKASPAPAIEDLPGGSEIDDFLNDA